MSQQDLLERLNGVIRRTIEARQEDGDIVEWSTALVPTYAECAAGHIEFEFVLGVYARVYCPEIQTTMVNNLMWPLDHCEDSQIAAYANGWWDSLTVERMAEAMAEEDAAEDHDAPTDTPT